MFSEDPRSLSVRARLAFAILSLTFTPLASAFVSCGPNPLAQRQQELHISLLALSRAAHAIHHSRAPLPSNNLVFDGHTCWLRSRRFGLRMSDSESSSPQCKFSVGDQVRVLVKTITLAKTAVQAGEDMSH